MVCDVCGCGGPQALSGKRVLGGKQVLVLDSEQVVDDELVGGDEQVCVKLGLGCIWSLEKKYSF